ncbi:MAG: tRNA (adenosine(37)-N6)-threonylcarbamoyltransferase complex dimerization subunit type 1 TsaB [Bacteroidetes bacterium]|nr:tRNA (adenosine(37)-N6)-threonylcarbamoyltransferase complex dimerization subunit type 1 TsaB [Bacteroidota bacterium]
MALILNIDTSSPVCSVCIADRGQVVAHRDDLTGNQHASLLAILVRDTLHEAGLTARDLSGVALSSGPGSYTGLRIGTSLAKGLCYGLDLPLIAIPTLMGMAWQMAATMTDVSGIYVPMIDARRDDAYIAVYDAHLNLLEKDTFVTVDTHLYDRFLRLYDSNIYFGGTASHKMINIFSNTKFGTVIENVKCISSNISMLSYEHYQRKIFSDLTYFEPFYLKEFEGRIKTK